MAGNSVDVIYRGPSNRIRPAADGEWAYKNGEPFTIDAAAAAALARKGGGGHRFEIVGKAADETRAEIETPADATGRSIDLPANPEDAEDPAPE